MKKLNDNIEILNLTGISSYHYGVSDTWDKVPFYVHPTNTGGHTIVAPLADPQAKECLINVIPIREVLEIVTSSEIDLLKLDCEGAEKQIILNLKKDDAARIKTIIYEQHGKLYTSGVLTSHLENIGFECRRKGHLTIAKRREAFCNC